MILVDTSAWVELLRNRAHERFAAATAGHEIITCLPVIQKVLQGVGDDRAYALAARAFKDIRVVEEPLTRGVFDEAVALFRAARRAGVTVRSSVDCLIAVCSLRHGAAVLHVDRDFAHLTRVSALSVIPLYPPS